MERSIQNNTPKLGHCPLCFSRYTNDSYAEIFTLLGNKSIMRMSVCKMCYNGLDNNMVNLAFENTKCIDADAINKNGLHEEHYKKLRQEVMDRVCIFWTKDNNEILEKREEL